MISRKLAVGVVMMAAVFSVLSSQPALADGIANSSDSNHGAQARFTSINHYLTIYDVAYDGWGAYTRGMVNIGSPVTCIDENGYNSSRTCAIGFGASTIYYYACLEHNNGATVSYCGAATNDYLS